MLGVEGEVVVHKLSLVELVCGKCGNCWSEGTGAITRSLEAGRWTGALL